MVLSFLELIVLTALRIACFRKLGKLHSKNDLARKPSKKTFKNN